MISVAFGIDPARLVGVLHYDGTPITARFIAGAVASALPLATSAKARAQGSENSHSSRQDGRIHA